jgi:hypothetical protein
VIGSITVPLKDGHHYLWFKYLPAEDETAHATGPRPSGAYVERVYEAEDWTELGIGT